MQTEQPITDMTAPLNLCEPVGVTGTTLPDSITTPSPELGKAAQHGSGCEVEPLGEIQRNGDLSFYDESGDELYISKYNQNIVIGAESGASMERAHVRSLIAHLTAWLTTGSLDLKGLPNASHAAKDAKIKELSLRMELLIMRMESEMSRFPKEEKRNRKGFMDRGRAALALPCA